MRAYYYQQQREEFIVDEYGSISRPAIGMKASGQWEVVGAVRFDNFGHQVEFVPFPRCFEESREWLHKNGKGQWFIKDRDHGTLRVQMSPVLRAGCVS